MLPMNGSGDGKLLDHCTAEDAITCGLLWVGWGGRGQLLSSEDDRLPASPSPCTHLHLYWELCRRGHRGVCQSSYGLGSGAQKEQASSLPLPVSRRPCGAVPRHSLCWQAPRAGEDVVLRGEELEHVVQVTSQQVLAAQLHHAWEVVDFLEVLHVPEAVQSVHVVCPEHRPLVIFSHFLQPTVLCRPSHCGKASRDRGQVGDPCTGTDKPPK